MRKSDLVNAGAWVRRTVTDSRGSRIKETAAKACLNLATVIDVIANVEDIVGQRGEPCPVQSQTAVKKLRALLDVRAFRAKKDKSAKKPEQTARAEEVDPASEMTCGKPPYVAEIVRASGGTVWTAMRQFASESAAEIAIIKRAAALGHQRSGLSRHWVTDEAEHMIDYGSHVFYGRIMTAENWRTMKKETK